MKSFFVMLIATLFMGSKSYGEKMEPIAPRKPGTEVYSIAETKAFALSDGNINKWWRDSAIAIVNRALIASGETVQIDYSKIASMFDYIKYEFKDLDPYWNSRLKDGAPEFFWDKDGYSGMVAIFRYGKCICILYKPGCLNLLNITVKQSPFIPITPVPGILTRTDTLKVQTGTGQITIVNNIWNQNVISNSGNSTNENNNDIAVGGVTPGTASTPVTYVLGGQSVPSYQMMMQPISPTQGFWQQKSVNFGFGLDFNLGGNGGGNFQPQYTAPFGNMGGGRGTNSTGGQGNMGGGNGNGNNGNNGNQGGGRGN